jgi:hypothetical protein
MVTKKTLTLGYCASTDPQTYFATVCNLSSSPLRFMAEAKRNGDKLSKMADKMAKAGFPVFIRDAGNDQLALSACAGSDQVWKLALPSQFVTLCSN